MTREAINELKKYTLGKKNTEKVAINVLQLNRVIKALEQESILDEIKGYIDHIRNAGMGKKKSLEFIEKFVEGLKNESIGNS